ncbi:MAG: type II and III secretion system protein family protein [Rhizobiales bacterium]|nr:type II and III secretion system protein family protein [Hyphomicrobiales bacterium]
MHTLMKALRAATAAAAICLVPLAALTGEPTAAFADPATQHTSVLRIAYEDALPTHRVARIGINKSLMVEFPRELRDVVVSDPEILDAVVHTSSRVSLIARKRGQANAFFFDSNGERIMTLEVSIERDTNQLADIINRLIPGANVSVEMMNETVILTGSVPRPVDSNRANDIAARFIVSPAADANERHAAKVINMLTVQSREQVLVKVTVAEMKRTAIKRLGVNWSNVNIGDYATIGGTQNAFPLTSAFGANSLLTGTWGPSADRADCFAPGGVGVPGTIGGLGTGNAILPNNLGFAGTANCLTKTLEAFERHGLARTLAEPTLVAISGETATFLAGGEFPIRVLDNEGNATLQFKPFGVGLSFTPMVMSEERISVKVATEVSELDSTVEVLGAPGLKVNRANTTVEMSSGGSLVLAGLISDDTRQNYDALPGITNLPILGALFRSRDYQKKETELVIILTPYMVKPVARDELSRPDDNWMPASDLKAIFLGEMNRMYGHDVAVQVGGSTKDSVGWIVE